MQESGRLSRHFWLIQGMARTLGVNLNEALRTGRLGRNVHAGAIADCCACGKTARCMGWLAQQGAGADELPRYCRLKPLLEGLKTDQG